MKNFYFTSLFLSLSMGFFSFQANAQAPQSMSYQSVIRNSSNALLANTAVGIKISVLQGSSTGNEAYVETQTATTNANGLVSLQIGAGTADIGTFSEIDWANGPYFIKTEIDPTGGSNYSITGTQQMASVPYALYAAKSGGTVFETTADDPAAIHNTNPGNVGIGTDLPSEKLDVSGNLRVRQNEIVEGNSMVQGNSMIGQNLEVNGLAYINSLTIPSGNPAQGKVLTSDNNGAATWQTPVSPDLSGYATTTDLNITAAQLAAQNNLQSSQIDILNYELANTNDQVQTNGSIMSALHELQADQIATLNNGLANTNEQVQTNTTNIAGLQSQLSTVQSNFVITQDDPSSIYNVNPGNVGIGTDLPSEKLDVSGNLRVRQNEIVEGNSLVQGNSLVNGYLEVSGLAVFNSLNMPIGADQGKVLTSDIEGYATWQMPAPSVFEPTIDMPDAIHNTNAGNVGIGTDLPYEKLDVAGNVRVRENLYVEGNSRVSQNLTVYGNLLFPGGQPNIGKVLTSDMLGYATWQTPVSPDLSGYATTTDLNTTAAQLAAQNNLQSVQISDLNTGLSNTNTQVQNLDIQNAVQSSQIATLNNGLANTNNQVQTNENIVSALHGLQADQISTLNNQLGNTSNQVQTNTTNIAGLQNQLSTVQSNFVTTIDMPDAIHNTNAGNVGIGTEYPMVKLDVDGDVLVRRSLIVDGTTDLNQNVYVNGNIRIGSGYPAQGKVLTSDNNGNATWQTPVTQDLSGYATTTDLNITAAQLATQNNLQSVQISDLNTGLANTNTQVQNLDIQNAVQSSQIATLNNTLNNGLANTNNQVQTNITNIAGLQNQLSTVQSNFVTTIGMPDAIHNTNAGNVGIGTEYPMVKLDVDGDVLVRRSLIVDGTTDLNQNVYVNGNISIYSGYPAQGKVLTSDNNGNATWQSPAPSVFEPTADFPDAIHNTNAGNVGIGTDLPSEKLDVNGNVRVRENLYVEGNSTAVQNLSVNQILTVGGAIITAGNSDVFGTATANSFVKAGGQATEYLMADGSVSTGATGGSNSFETTADDATAIHNTNPGNVGIGTDLPSAKLDVAGDIRIRGGNPAQGKVLTSDENGTATWQTPAASDLSGYATTTDVTNLQSTVINNQIQSDNLLAQTQYLQNQVLDNQSALTAKEDAINKSQDINLGNSDILFPTQNATKTYVDNRLATMSTVFETTADDATAIHNTNAGNVGIGTDLPSQKLDVAGNLRVRGNVGIGTETPNTSAALEINSTTGSLLIPRMTTAERNNLTAAEGMIIYNTSTSSYQGISKIVTNAAPVVDQSNFSSQYPWTTSNGGQSFRAGLSGALTGVSLRYSVNSNTSVTFYIRDGAGTSGPILYQTTVDITAESGMQIRNVNISGVNLIAGNFYTINIVSSVSYLTMDFIDEWVYGDGLIFHNGDGYGFSSYFSTTVTPPLTSSLQWENFSNGSTAVPGATGPAGPAGPQGLTGATGPAGSSSFATTAADETAIYNTNTGNVGIGTDLPSEKLDVVGNIKSSGTYTGKGIITTTGAYYEGNVIIGVYGGYDPGTPGVAVAGIGYEGENPPAGRDIGVYGTSSDVAVYSNGPLVVTDGSQGLGKVLTSDEDGKASWQTPNAASSLTLEAIGSSANANGATIAEGILNLQPANASFGGVVTTGAQTFAGNKTFTGTITGTSFVKTGGGATDFLMANGSTTTGSVVSSVAQTFAGNKTFSGNVITNGNVIISNPISISIPVTGTANAANILTGFITSTTFAAVSITLPTATAIATAIGGTVANGTSLEFSVYNIGSTNAVTLILGTGITVQTAPVIAGSNSLIIAAAAKMGHFRLVFTSSTTAMLFRIY